MISPLKLCFIDLETTGLDPKLHAVVQIAGIIEIDGVTKDHFDFRAKPGPGKMIDEAALKVHGLTKEKLEGFIGPSFVHADLCDILCKHVDKFNRSDKFFFVGYNSRFDEDFLRQFFLDCGDKYFGSFFWTPSIDVMQMAALALLSQRATMANFKLGTVYEAIAGHAAENLHDASADINQTRELFHLLRKQHDQSTL